MESPHGVPEVASPVVLLPRSTEFSYSIARTEVTANTVTRPSAIPSAIPSIIHPGTNQPRARSIAATLEAPNNSFSVLGSHGSETATAGPNTRSRKRSHSGTQERSTEADVVQPAASAPSRKRKTPSSSSKACRSRNRKKPPPGSDLKSPPDTASPCGKSDGNDDAADKKPAPVVENCCICMCDVEPNDLAMIDSCDHRFCFGCIDKWSAVENKCPLCKTRFNKIERVHKKYKKGSKNTKKVKQRDQRSEYVSGAGLEGLLANLHRNSGSLARLILGNFEFSGTTARAAMPTYTTGVQSDYMDEESDDDDSPMAAFMRALHGSSVANGISMSHTVVRPMTVTAHFSTTTRSFARNMLDSTAGNGADNPLEIDDDSVNEVIEIE